MRAPASICPTSRHGGFRVAVLATSSLIAAALFIPIALAQPPGPSDFAFSTAPSLFPNYSRSVHNYVVRCNNSPVQVSAHTSTGWEAKVGDRAFRQGDFTLTVSLRTGRAFTINVRQVGTSRLYAYHVRCLPNGFPTYTFNQSGPVSPRLFSVDAGSPQSSRYAIIFDNHGVPIWWDHAPAWDTKVLADGNVLWHSWKSGRHEIHRLDGGLVATLRGVGIVGDPHDMQVLSDGSHLVGAYVRQSHVDTSAYGGSRDADVAQAELQQVSSHGKLLWDWNTRYHISLAETGRHWPGAIKDPTPMGYDITHWNSIEAAGGSVIASFRNLDAVYKIDKSSGHIVWKLGGTTTSKSLSVTGDSHAYTLGAQHDARRLPDGTVTVFDNRAGLNSGPEAVRFSIDEQNGTATLLESITDPSVTGSSCCGSARRLRNGDWLIDWGGRNPIGGYEPDGERSFLLRFDHTFSYRAQPVPPGVLSIEDLRRGMNAMSGSG